MLVNVPPKSNEWRYVWGFMQNKQTILIHGTGFVIGCHLKVSIGLTFLVYNGWTDKTDDQT